MINLTPVVNAIVALLASVITIYLLPWLRSKYSAQELGNAAYWAKVLVAAAEQMFSGAGRGEEKLSWVQTELARRGWKLDTNEIRALIEAQVREIALGSIVAPAQEITLTGSLDAVNWQQEVPPGQQKVEL